MNNLKYIVGESGDIAIFSPTATHQDVARTMMSKPAGAGFVKFTPDKFDEPILIECFGESVSLNHLKSRKHIDGKAIYKAIYNE